jgi:trk system potassium uptake protein TrkH
MLVEVIGAVLIYLSLRGQVPLPEAVGSACFHSVSAFCNAGFSPCSDSLVSWRGNPLLMGTVMLLITLGGLGHVVIREVIARLRHLCSRRGHREARRLPYHVRVVLLTSALLILVGWIGLVVLDGPASGESFADRVGVGLFQSVSARTAGFNTVAIGALPPAALLLLVFLMFVGGSPASCAGGIKTTTLAIWIATLRSRLRGGEEVRLLGRRIPALIVKRVGLLVGLALLWNFVGLLLLTVTEGGERPAILEQALFEQVSAFGTVGLSTGLTPGLSAVGKVWIALTMFVGRLGPLTLATWSVRNGRPRVKHPDGRILVG